MFKVIKKYTRSSIVTPFYSELGTTDDIALYIKQNYFLTGKFVSSSSEYSEDKLTLTQTLIFKTKHDFSEFIKDEFLGKTLFGPRQYYDIQNEICNDFVYIGE